VWSPYGRSIIAYRIWPNDHVGAINNIHWQMAWPCLWRKPMKLRRRQIVQKTFLAPYLKTPKNIATKRGETTSRIKLSHNAKFHGSGFHCPRDICPQTNTADLASDKTHTRLLALRLPDNKVTNTCEQKQHLTSCCWSKGWICIFWQMSTRSADQACYPWQT